MIILYKTFVWISIYVGLITYFVVTLIVNNNINLIVSNYILRKYILL